MAPNTAKPVTIGDLEGPVRDLLGLTIALHGAIEGIDRLALSDGEDHDALSILAGTVANVARDLSKLWEQAFKDQRGLTQRQQLAEFAERKGRAHG